MGTYRFSFILMDSDGSLCVLICTYASLLVLMHLMDCDGSLCFLIYLHVSLWELMGLYWSL